MSFNISIGRYALTFLLLLGPISICWPISGRVSPYGPVAAQNGMVASSDRIASEVGIEILKRGGNAIDAAVALALTLAVTHPAAGNVGGGGFMLIRMADGRTTAIDYREIAPLKAQRGMYLNSEGNLLPQASSVGYLAVGVPGTVAGLALALEKYGTLKWSEVIEPARKLAERGFEVSHQLANDLYDHRELLGKFPESRRIFLYDGNFYKAGDTLKQPELSATLNRLITQGPREFYEGKTGQLIAEDMKANGGLITLQDLQNYKAVERQPVVGTYRGYEVISMPPPSSGGAVLLEMLNMLENYDLATMGYSSSKKYHILIEVMRRAFADRAVFFGDPDFEEVPCTGLTSKNYANQQLNSINPNQATPSQEISSDNPTADESEQTTHFSVVDKMGNAVSNTYTVNTAYGSGATVNGAGFLLNNEMDDFTAKPGVPNLFGLVQGQANAIAPSKRPLSSMAPTIVTRDGKLYVVIGSPGGPTIINTVLQIMLNVIDHGMNLQQAIDAPRLHHQWLPDVVYHEPYGLAQDIQDNLKKLGHTLATKPQYMGDAEGIMFDQKLSVFLGASDPRNPDAEALGY